MRKRLLLPLVLLVSFLNSCEDDTTGPAIPTENDTAFLQNFGNVEQHDFIGQIIDTSNNPISGAIIQIGSTSIQTDVNGVFIINNASVYEQFAYITAKKIGYIDGSRAVVPLPGKNNVTIMLLPNTPTHTIMSGVVSEVSAPSGTKVAFDGNFITENGNGYTGEVSVTLTQLQTSDENRDKIMPGMLYGKAEDGSENMLETFGMLNVELRGNTGQKLQPAKGHPAQITMQIDSSQLATAPQTIPLWHFDEVQGFWKEDGVATKTGDKYIGTVSHFSWWNCDAGFPTVSMKATVLANGLPLKGVFVALEATMGNTLIQNSGLTNDAGMISGLVPSNKVMTIKVLTSDLCGVEHILYTASIGPFSSDTTLPPITVNTVASTVLRSNIFGRLLRCDHSIVTNGYIILKQVSAAPMVASVTNGEFSFNALYCSLNTNFSLQGVDFDNLEFTDAIEYNFIPVTTAIGNLVACNSTDEFITTQIDNNTSGNLVLGNIAVFVDANSFTINAAGLFIAANTTTPGTYTTSDGFNYYGSVTIQNGVPNDIHFQINQFGSNIGEFIDMTIYGTYIQSGVTHTLNTLVHVKRTN